MAIKREQFLLALVACKINCMYLQFRMHVGATKLGYHAIQFIKLVFDRCGSVHSNRSHLTGDVHILAPIESPDSVFDRSVVYHFPRGPAHGRRRPPEG